MHELFMRRAFELARLGQYTARPNPMVGCVIVNDHQVVGEGYHACYGAQHAESMALAEAGEKARGATCYVTLEPCNHVGKTPPCASHLVAAGIKRVVIANRDPCPLVNGAGISCLRSHGIEVIENVLAEEGAWLNRAFFHRMMRHRPWVVAKLAVSLDGKIADSNGVSQWMSGELARHDVQKLRAASGAIMVGSKTILQDNPRLTVRDQSFISENLRDQFQPPKKVLIDSTLSLPAGAQAFSGGGSVLIYTAKDKEKNDFKAEIILAPNHNGRVDLERVLKDLASRQVNQVLVEGGGLLVGSLFEHHLVNELILYHSGMLLGNKAISGFYLEEKRLLKEQEKLHLVSVEKLGHEVKSCWTL